MSKNTSAPVGKNTAQQLATGAIVALIGKIGGRVLSVSGNVILARLLGPAVYGIYALGWTILRIVGLIAPLGLDKAVIKFGSLYWDNDYLRLRSVIFQSLFFTMVSSASVSVGVYFLAPFLADRVFHEPELLFVIRGFAFAIIFFSGMKVAAATTRISKQMKYSVLSEDFTQPAAFLLFVLIFFYFFGRELKISVVSGVLSFVVAFIVALIFVVKLTYRNSTKFSFKFPISTKELLSFSVPTSFVGIFGMLLMWTDRLLIGYFGSSYDVGVYQAISQVSMIFTIIVGAFGAMLSPYFASLFQAEKIDNLNRVYKIGTKWGLYIGVPLFLLILFSGKDLIVIVFGNEYLPGATPMLILATGQMINLATGTIGPLLIMTGRQRGWLTIYGTMFLLNIVLNLILIPVWGLIGAALSTSITVAGAFVSGVVFAKYKINIWAYDKSHYKWIGAMLLTSTFVGGINSIFTIDSIMVRFFTNLLIISIGFITLLVMFGLEEEDKDFLKMLRKRIIN